MQILTHLRNNNDWSKWFIDNYKVNIATGGCYFNISKFVEAILNKLGYLPQNLQVAYGYMGRPMDSMARHCFFIFNGEIVDPTCPEVVEPNEYHIFKIFNLKDYIDSYKHAIESEDFTALFKWMQEEKVYCDYAIKRKINIDIRDYEFLDKFDEFGEIYCSDTKLSLVNDRYLLTAGKPLSQNEVKQYADRTILWVANDIPFLAIKEGNRLIAIQEPFKGAEICSINDIGTKFTAQKYLCEKT